MNVVPLRMAEGYVFNLKQAWRNVDQILHEWGIPEPDRIFGVSMEYSNFPTNMGILVIAPWLQEPPLTTQPCNCNGWYLGGDLEFGWLKSDQASIQFDLQNIAHEAGHAYGWYCHIEGGLVPAKCP